MSVQPEESDEEEGAAATDHNDDAEVLGKDAEDDEDAREVLKLEALPNTQPPGLPLTTSPLSLLLPGPSSSAPSISPCRPCPTGHPGRPHAIPPISTLLIGREIN